MDLFKTRRCRVCGCTDLQACPDRCWWIEEDLCSSCRHEPRYREASALLSPCGLYRFRLWRRWAPGPVCGFLMLNPSTADGETDDLTIRRCVGFAKREGCGALMVVNLFAFRATDPSELLTAADPVGPDADHHLLDALQLVDGPLIAGWGANADHPKLKRRAEDITAMLGIHMSCLGRTASGAPRHPSRLAADTPLILFGAPDA